MRPRSLIRGALGTFGILASSAALPLASATETSAQETLPLIWVITIISVAGAALTFAAMIYALWKFRDPATKGRRYG